MDDPAEQAALLRLRVLRRDGYQCMWAPRVTHSTCGLPAPFIGARPSDDAIVALCLKHSVGR